MKSLLCIQSYAGAKDRVRYLWPHLQASGLDILGTCPTNSKHDWPQGCRFVHNIGTEDGWLTKNFLLRWLQLWQVLLYDTQYSDYDSFLVTPFDVIFLHAPPPFPGGLVTHLAGWKLGYGERASYFFHPPWWADRDAAKVILEHGRKLVSQGVFELNAPDVFLGLIVEQTKLPWKDCQVYSVGSGMMNDCLPKALAAVKQGAWFVHGIANETQMNALLAAKP